MIGFRFGLIEGVRQQCFALAGFAIIAFENFENFPFLFLDVVVNVLQLGFEPQHFGEIGTILLEGVRIIRRRLPSFLQQLGESRIAIELGDGIQVARFGKFVEGLLLHALGLGIRVLLVDVAQPLRGHVLFIVERPYLILALVGDARVFRLLDFYFEVPQLVGEPIRGLRRSLVLAAVILLDVGRDVGVDGARGKPRVGGFEAHVHQAAVGNPPHTEIAKECGEFGRAGLVREIAVGNSLRDAAGLGELRTKGETIVADGLQCKRFAGQDF